MKRRGTVVMLSLLLFWSSPALAWDPFGDHRHVEPPATPEPEPDLAPDPTPFIAPPPDLYYVTDTYVADVVTSNGPLTTYSTATVHESTGSYARVLETVGTSASSAYDGSSFNGRRALGDGRLVAGTYYQNYVRTDDGFVPVSIVFFQDDAEIARLQSTPRPVVTTSPPPAPLRTAGPHPPACCAAERPLATAAPAPTPIPPRAIRPGLSLLPASAPLAGLEVLRGRTVSLWPRAFVDDREVPVGWWTVIGGEAGEALATAGSGGVPFRSSWRRLAPPGAAFEVVFRIEVETPETGHRTVDAAIAVVVRSPALEH